MLRNLKGNRCQCCNSTLSTDFRLVFDETGRKQNIASLLFDHIGKKLKDDNGIRHAICQQCWQQLIKYREFRRKCLLANAATSDGGDGDDDFNDEGDNSEYYKNEIDDTLTTTHSTAEDHSYENEISKAGDYIEKSRSPLSDAFDDSELDYMVADYLDENFSFDENVETETKINNKITDDADKILEQLKSVRKLPFDFSQILIKPVLPPEIIRDEDLDRVKHIIQNGYPRHEIHNDIDKGAANQNLDVEKIVTSDDLIHILDDDYRNESNYSKQSAELAQMTTDTMTEIEYLEEYEPINIDKYLKSISAFSYSEVYDPYVDCKLCPEVIISQQHLVYHAKERHSIDDRFLCIFDENCSTMDDLTSVQQHIFNQHIDLIP